MDIIKVNTKQQVINFSAAVYKIFKGKKKVSAILNNLSILT